MISNEKQQGNLQTRFRPKYIAFANFDDIEDGKKRISNEGLVKIISRGIYPNYFKKGQKGKRSIKKLSQIEEIVEDVLDYFANVINEGMAQDYSITLRHIGTFKLRTSPGREFVLPDGQKRRHPDREIAHFDFTRSVQQRIKQERLRRNGNKEEIEAEEKQDG